MSWNWIVCIFGLLFVGVCPALFAQAAERPPAAKQVEHFSDWHGEKVNDPFHWVREKSNPDVIKYLEDENAYTTALTKEIQPFADIVYKEMLGHIKQTDLTVPVRRGDYSYYSRTEEGKQYPIQCRKRIAGEGHAGEGAEEILLDLNELGERAQVFVTRRP